MPSATRRLRRSLRTLLAIPRLASSSSNRWSPRATSRMISSVQRSPITSSARAIEQTCPSYVRFSTDATLPLACFKQAGSDKVTCVKQANSTEPHMATDPSREYTRSWCPSGEIDYLELADGTRLRYLRTGSGTAALVLLHTVRTQLDHFQLVIPQLRDAFTVYPVDLPGMGWSDITAGASYAEPALRHAVIELVTSLNLTDVTLAGESMGATLSLTAATELRDRVR